MFMKFSSQEQNLERTLVKSIQSYLMYQDSTAGKMKNFLFANVSWAQAFSLLRLCQRNMIFCRLFFFSALRLYNACAVKKAIKVKKFVIIACKEVLLYII